MVACLQIPVYDTDIFTVLSAGLPYLTSTVNKRRKKERKEKKKAVAKTD